MLGGIRLGKKIKNGGLYTKLVNCLGTNQSSLYLTAKLLTQSNPNSLIKRHGFQKLQN